MCPAWRKIRISVGSTMTPNGDHFHRSVTEMLVWESLLVSICHHWNVQSVVEDAPSGPHDSRRESKEEEHEGGLEGRRGGGSDAGCIIF